MRGLWKHWALKRVSSHWFAGVTMGGPWGWNPHSLPSLPVAQTQLAAFAAQLILALCLRRHFGDSPVPRMPQEAAVRGSRQAILEPAFSNRRSCSLSCTTSKQGKGVEFSSLLVLHMPMPVLGKPPPALASNKRLEIWGVGGTQLQGRRLALAESLLLPLHGCLFHSCVPEDRKRVRLQNHCPALRSWRSCLSLGAGCLGGIGVWGFWTARALTPSARAQAFAVSFQACSKAATSNEELVRQGQHLLSSAPGSLFER